VSPNKKFRLANRFRGILPHQRLRFLQRSASGGFEIDYATLKRMRAGFDRNKVDHLPLGIGTKCYCCGLAAVLRHHVVPLFNGGRNKRTNIVPLCDSCHCKVHPNMGKSPVKREKEALGPGSLSSMAGIVAVPRVITLADNGHK
jgi:5-methylcytosine-specific restriction endonuclease McrA